MTPFINISGKLCIDNIRGLFEEVGIKTLYLPFGIVIKVIEGTNSN